MSAGSPWRAALWRTAAFLRSSVASTFIGPEKIAPVGQISSHARGMSKGRSFPGVWQKLHFSIFPATAESCGAPNGQAQAQNPQPMHLFWSTVTMPFSALLLIADTGQAVLQGASPQCMHAIETFMAFTAG